MVELGLKLEDLLTQKGLENKSKGGKVNRYEAINRREAVQKSDKLPESKKENLTAKDKLDTMEFKTMNRLSRILPKRATIQKKTRQI